MEERLKHLFILLALLTLTTCATRQPLPPIIPPRVVGTTLVEYADGTLFKYENQYRTRAEGIYVIFEHTSGSVHGLTGIVGWKWDPDKPKPKIQSVADN